MASIVVERLGKVYKRYASPWGRVVEWGSGGRRVAHESRWALRGVSFAVRSGEAVGIIGQNGAGKSTLLKILTGTTQPTEGRFEIGGRVAALLELGMGFHPDFTGLQNAVMGCQMLGLSGAAVTAALPGIERFSELSDFMDQPLRCFSTGMQMRLAFGVATAVRPEILVVDEALAVGDAYFQHKSMARIRAFRDQGTTLLLVSHDPGAVKSLCDRALLLDRGQLARDGVPDAVLDYYNALIAKREHDAEIQQHEATTGRWVTRSGSGRAKIASAELADGSGRPCRAFRVGDRAGLRCAVRFEDDIEAPTVGLLIRDRLGNDVFGTNTFHLKLPPAEARAGEVLAFDFAIDLNLGPGHYSIALAVHLGATHMTDNLDWWDQALVFQVVPGDGYFFAGTAMLPVQARMIRTATTRQEPRDS